MSIVCDKCLVCKHAKSEVQPHGHYTPLPVSTMPWINISMDFILGYTVCLRPLCVDKDSRFLSHFSRTLWSKLGIKLLFSLTYHFEIDGQTKVMNMTLAQLFRCFMGKNLLT
ncbi:hypothetical protein CR513_26107, partial [Mucuna pruriens]